MDVFRLSDHYNIELLCDESHLQTLGLVLDFKFTDEAIKMLSNLKKMEIEFDLYEVNWDAFNLSNIFHLQNLEELEVSLHGSWQVPLRWNYNFPISVRKLTLTGVPLPWDNMTIIGSLPNLQVLQILNELDETEPSEWTTVEGQFLRLKYFRSTFVHLVKWEVEKEHFPSLETLVLVSPWWMDEIPCCIAEIDSLQLIALEFCRESIVNSAKQILAQQHENGKYAFQVSVLDQEGSYISTRYLSKTENEA